ALVERGEADALAKVLEQRDTLALSEAELRRVVAGASIEVERPPSIFAAHLAELKALCDQHGAELVVVALPIDVQVSPEEWAKYGAEPVDMAPSLALLADTVADAEALGAIGVEPTAALAAAEPGAFLDGDIHMTAKGHDALAHAIVDAMTRPPELVKPGAGLPAGRTPVPSPRAWIEAGEVTVKGSTDAGCRTQIIDEWFRVSCNRRKPKLGAPTGVTMLEGDGAELMHLVAEDTAVLLAPLRSGEPLRARFDFEKQSLELQVGWPVAGSGKPRFVATFVPASRPADAITQSGTDALAAQLCKCHAGVTRERTGTQHSDADGYGWVENERPACTELYGGRSAACADDYFRDCVKLLACMRGDPLAAPSCEAGETLVAASNVCAPACDDAHPCAQGSCEPYNGGGICR
ncbi:MAG: hypothetical protein IAG13_16890, partial [Deltaproteobacteria bacterium]|nr:hypothetical protein [Nannocystaceae bacterium]